LLLRYEFDSILIERGPIKVDITKNEMFYKFSEDFKKIKGLIGEKETNQLINYFSHVQDPHFFNHDLTLSSRSYLKEISYRHKIPISYLMKSLESMYASNRFKQLSLFESDSHFLWQSKMDKFHEDRVIFWPTFRRVEKYLKVERDENESSAESYAFGMTDIENKLSEIEKGLSADALSLTANMNRDLIVDTLNLKKPPESFFNTLKQQIPEIELILDRTKILKDKKNHLLKIVEEGMIKEAQYLPLAQIIYRLLEGFEKLAEKDMKIKRFAKAVNNYLVENELVYDDRTVQISCRNKTNKRPLKLEYLSSGEKHIVGFMSHLYLFEQAKCVVIIDEPELSLSSEWQEKLLVDIMDSGQVKQLVCATHSPFIFNNKYDNKAVPLFSEVAKNVK
jgi:hypothetical protein